MTPIFVLTNHKGGVGKSTSATNLAYGVLLVMQKAGVENPRVLLIDTDSQGHTSLVTTGRNDYGQHDSLHTVLVADRQNSYQVLLNSCVASHWHPNLFVIPASKLLDNTERELMSTSGVPYRLSKALDGWERPKIHKLHNRSGELWQTLVALAAFFEEVGIAGLLTAIGEAAEFDQQFSDGKSLSEREEALLQALEMLSRNTTDSYVWVKAAELRELVQKFLGLSAEQLGSAQWIGRLLKQLQLVNPTPPRWWSTLRHLADRSAGYDAPL